MLKKERPTFRAVTAMTDKFANQELLPPISEEPNGLSGWVSWLFDPLPQRFMLPATGLLMLGLDWFLFSGEAATLGLAIPAASFLGWHAGRGLGAGLFWPDHDKKPTIWPICSSPVTLSAKQTTGSRGRATILHKRLPARRPPRAGS